MCNSCEVLNINGVNCHEIGCPDAWMDYDAECLWCGSKFIQQEKWDEFCDESCYEAYHGEPLLR